MRTPSTTADAREQRTLWRTPTLNGVRVLALDRVARPWRGTTDALAIALHRRGPAEVSIRRRTSTLAPGTITICAPHEPSIVRRHGEASSLVFHILPARLAQRRTGRAMTGPAAAGAAFSERRSTRRQWGN